MPETNKGDVFQCGDCGGEFIAAWNDTDARAQRAEVFGAPHKPTDIKICEDCYRRLMERVRSKFAELFGRRT